MPRIHYVIANECDNRLLFDVEISIKKGRGRAEYELTLLIKPIKYLAIAEQKWKKWRQILSCNFIDFLLLYLNKKRK